MKLFLGELVASRTRAADYEVKLFGGGRMFKGSARFKRAGGIAETRRRHVP